jgi:hypothetical protein
MKWTLFIVDAIAPNPESTRYIGAIHMTNRRRTSFDIRIMLERVSTETAGSVTNRLIGTRKRAYRRPAINRVLPINRVGAE